MISEGKHMPVEARASKILIGLGFSTDHLGYEYIRRALIESYHTPEITYYVTKTLYPKIARLHGTSFSCVSRACRRAIEYACDYGELYDFLGIKQVEAYPPSALVISSLADYLHRLQK